MSRKAVKTQEFDPETMYISKITGEVKKLSKFGKWWRENSEYSLVLASGSAVNQ